MEDYAPMSLPLPINEQWQEEERGRDSGSAATAFNLFNDVLASGAVAMPYYVQSIGIILLVPFFFFFAVVSQYTLRTLYEISEFTNVRSFPELCFRALGYPGYVWCCLVMVGPIILKSVFEWNCFQSQLQL